MKKILSLLMVALLALGAMSMFTGCSSADLVVSTMFGGGDSHESVFTDINDTFAEAKGITIEDRSGSSTSPDWLDAFASDMTSKNNIPDVVFYFNGANSDAWRDGLVSVDDIIAESDEFKTAYEKITVRDTDDASIELKGFSYATMYNSDVYDTDDFTDYETLIAALTENAVVESDRAAVAGDLPHYWFNHMMAYYLGIEEFEEFDGTKAFFDAETLATWKTAFYNTVTDMRAIGYVGTGATNGTEDSQFFAGERGLLLDGNWKAGSVTDSSANIELTGFVADKDGADFVLAGISSGWYITKSCWEDETKRALAIEYVMAHITDDAINKYCVAGGGTTANGKAITGATDAITEFTDIAQSYTQVMPLDDRMSATAKAAFLSTWDVNYGLPKLVDQATAPTEDECNTRWDEFVATLA